jgi:3'-5' exoribonuclease
MSTGPARTVKQMESDLRELLATVQSAPLRDLLDGLLGTGSQTWAAYRDAPAAKHYHHAYRHGLLEHCLGVARTVGAIAAMSPGVDRDVAVTGALLHDIGKLDTYKLDGDVITMTTRGRLHGEIALGHSRVRQAIEQIEGFPAETADAILHIILSHHGSLEHGSPVVPAIREATIVHLADNLDSKLAGYDRLQAALEGDAVWSEYDRSLGTSAYFGTSTEPLMSAPVRAAA